MTIFRENIIRITTTPLTDVAGALITTGTVQLAIMNVGRTATLLAAQAMTHVAAGVWRYDLTTAQISALTGDRVRLVVTVGSPVSATFERVETVGYRETA